MSYLLTTRIILWLILVGYMDAKEQIDGPEIEMFELPLELGIDKDSSLFRTIARGLVGSNNDQIIGNFLERMIPRVEWTVTTTTTTTTTTPSPLHQLGKNFEDLGQTFVEGTKIIQAPLKVLNGFVASSAALGAAGTKSVDKAADKIVKATETTTNVVSRVSQPADSAVDLIEAPDYDFFEESDQHTQRKPKYFSRECHFRVACEVGRIMIPLNLGIAKWVKSSKLLQDLQNKYTRAITYGTLNNKCDRYYCFLVALFGGPVGFAKGVAELMNTFVSPDNYDGDGLN